MNTDLLTPILERKRAEVEERRVAMPETALHRRPPDWEGRGFRQRLAAARPGVVNIIAEIKRASPSKGIIRNEVDVGELACAYERGGAAALSVLTDEAGFGGSLEDLVRARRATGLPVLRKDFVVSQYQVYEAAAYGADAVLLIVRALPGAMLSDCLGLAGSLGLDALVEVHTEEELGRATEVGAELIGMNNRDLRTFRVDTGTALRLAPLLQEWQVGVAESGIASRSDMEPLVALGVRNFLIGETLMRAADPGERVRELSTGWATGGEL